MFIAALFTILFTYSSYASSQDVLLLRIKKMWYLYRMEFYSATKKSEILTVTGKWMELEKIILREVMYK
jgi:hypothetical protein